MSSRRYRLIGIALALFGIVAFSLRPVLIKLAYGYVRDPITLIALRMMFALPFFLAAALWSARGGRAAMLSVRELLAVFGLGALGYYFASTLDFIGLQYVTAGVGRLLLFLYPTIVVLLSASRRDLKLKLLEIYFVWGNKDLFLDTARELHSTRGQAAPGEWDKVLIMGKQIAPDDSMFQGEAGAARVDLVDVNLEGGENRVDVDLFAEPDADRPTGLDLEFVSGERKGLSETESGSDLDFLLDEPKRGSDEEPTREMDPLARTQETPTIESPMIDRGSQTIRERADKAAFAKAGTDQTAELSLDDLGLDVDSLEHSGSLEDTTSLEKDTTAESQRPLRDDEMTQLAPSISSFDRTMEAPRVESKRADKFDIESTGTIYIDQVDLSGGDTVEQQRPDVDSTASMKRPKGMSRELDVDLDNLSSTAVTAHDSTVRQPRSDSDRFSSDVFADRTAEVPRVDLDVGDPLAGDDREPTNKQVITAEMELSELEPVTMSEVGTKLDLARAYMDMGDPDGARSILEEVLAEGNPNQKQEAQRLMESIR